MYSVLNIIIVCVRVEVDVCRGREKHSPQTLRRALEICLTASTHRGSSQLSMSTRFLLSELLAAPSSSSSLLNRSPGLAECLKLHSYAVIEIDASYESSLCCDFLHADELRAIRRWIGLAKEKFLLDDDAKALCEYRNERGVMVGFRREDTRQFFETRLCHDGSVEPGYLADEERTFASIYSLYSKLAALVMVEVVSHLGLDCREFTDLTDINPALVDMLKQRRYECKHMVLRPAVDPGGGEFSSSLLRVCLYPPPPVPAQIPCDDSSRASNAVTVAFGAHTDTSFVTLGLASDVSGLQILDRESRRWVSVEEGEEEVDHSTTSSVVVFSGEFLQVLSRGAFEAAAHRVVSQASLYGERVSVPFIVRGRNRAVINIEGVRTRECTGSDEGDDDDDDDNGDGVFNGVTMKLMHSILDAKRKRCFDAHSGDNSDSEWILSSYPMECPPR